jgi:hypothetical protein
MDGNQDDLHVFREQDYDGKCCTHLGFPYYKSIDGSTASMVDAYNLVNTHKLNHNNTPPTQRSRPTQIDFIFVSSLVAEFIYRSGISDFNTIFSSDHGPLYIDIDILQILGLSDPRLIDGYQSSLIQ